MKALYEEVLRTLLETPTAPFREERGIGRIEALARKKGLSFRQDPWGNVLLGPAGATSGRSSPRWVFQAHLDHPGFVVVESSPGRAKAEFRGSVSGEYFPSSRVRFFPEGSRAVKGTLSRSKPHSDHREFPLTNIKLESKTVLAPGTIGMWDLPAMRLRGSRLISRACDDLVGSAAVICALLESSTSNPPDVLLTRGEEAGFVGALAACDAGTISPEVTLVSVETSREMPGARLGQGVVIRAGDRVSVFDPAVTDHLTRTAVGLAKQDRAFSYARQLMPGGVCESTVFCAYGLRAGALCLPLGNYHNMGRDGKILAERIDLEDFASLVKLLRAVAQEAPDLPEVPPIRSRLEDLLARRRSFLAPGKGTDNSG